MEKIDGIFTCSQCGESFSGLWSGFACRKHEQEHREVFFQKTKKVPGRKKGHPSHHRVK